MKSNKSNISEHKLVKDYRILSHQILRYEYHGLQRIDFLREVSKTVVDFSGCESVELWIKEHGKYYRYKTTRSPKGTYHFEIMPCFQDEDSNTIFGIQGNSCLERLCRDVIHGHFNATFPFFTKNGSFYTGNTENPLTFYPEAREKGSVRNITIGGDYKSLALIPIILVNENIGLLQLKSLRQDYFKDDDIDFYEGIVQTLSVALTHRRAHGALRERVKELTCLYSISKVVEQPGVSLEEILMSIVGLLPPAWLYHEIASARIILDKRSYSTPGFREGPHKQTANIVVNGDIRGVVEVVYAEEKPELDEGPFLKEERSLIDTIARELALIIERKQTEEDKARLQEQLRHADRLATIGQLSAGVAHELNEPLGNILGFAQLIKKCPGLPEQSGQDVDKIVKASLHAREVVKKLMLFSRQMPTKKTQVNLNQVIEESLYFLESRCAKEGIKLVRLLTPDLPEVTVDPSQLTQVLVNLVVNAIQAMPDGGTLTVQTITHGEEKVLLIVEDTGIGMSKDVMKQIFIPFFTTKNVSQGTGLGLAVVHGIINSHGGSIKVESKVGYGTKFTIQIPVKGSQEEKID